MVSARAFSFATKSPSCASAIRNCTPLGAHRLGAAGARRATALLPRPPVPDPGSGIGWRVVEADLIVDFFPFEWAQRPPAGRLDVGVDGRAVAEVQADHVVWLPH